jgi:hypothetical protein
LITCIFGEARNDIQVGILLLNLPKVKANAQTDFGLILWLALTFGMARIPRKYLLKGSAGIEAGRKGQLQQEKGQL